MLGKSCPAAPSLASPMIGNGVGHVACLLPGSASVGECRRRVWHGICLATVGHQGVAS